MNYADRFLSWMHEAETSEPRSRQRQVGPSGLGTDCWHCLGARLAELPEAEDDTYEWARIKGRALHKHMAEVAELNNTGNLLIEHRVTVGQVGEKTITGSSDLFDISDGVVTDWKFVDSKKIVLVRRGIVTPEYEAQPHLYGLGFENQGYTVSGTLLMFFAVDSPKLADAYPFYRPYRRDIAEAVLARARVIEEAIRRDGVNVVARLKRKPGCLNCAKYPL